MARPDLPPLLIGSHIDTVVGGGRFDGIIGVLAAVEGVRDARGVAFSLTPVSTAAPVLVPAALAEALGRTLLALDRAWCAGHGEA